jgi:hypothetical protein
MREELNIRDQVIQKVKQQLGTDAHDAQSSGSVLYNGWRTLCPGKVYVMGFNPGGPREEIQLKVGESLLAPELEEADYSDYKEPWYWRKRILPGGEHPHQRNVKEMVRCLGIGDIGDVFAANAIFVRSQRQDSLERKEHLWNKCWPIHQLFLSIVHPKIILCLGNGEKVSAFKLLLSKVKNAHVNEGRGHVKYFTSVIDLGDYGVLPDCMVIGVRHPSRFYPSQDVKTFLGSLSY